MRRKLSRALRKWADLIDPATNPTEVMTLRIECDPSQFEEQMSKIEAYLRRFGDAAAALGAK